MTATTFDETVLEGAPRRTVEDAWRTLNARYGIGTGVLLATLLLLWALGLGPGSGAPGAPSPVASTPPPAPVAPPGAVREAPAAAVAGGTASGGASSGADPAGAAASAAAAAGGTAAGPAPAGGGTSGGAGPRPVPGAPVARLYFEPDQAWPSGEVGPRLAPVLARLRSEPDTKALVSGFHDRRGSPQRNAALAQRRAQAVRRALLREGVPAERIVLAKPQQTLGSGADREARRVEVTVAR